MANRLYRQFRYSLEPMVVELYAKVSIGAAGAPTIVSAKGIASVVRNSAGDYTINLQDTYQKLLDADMISIVATVPASPVMSVKLDSSAILAAPLVEVVMSTGGVATDPASGEILLIRLALSNSTAP